MKEVRYSICIIYKKVTKLEEKQCVCVVQVYSDPKMDLIKYAQKLLDDRIEEKYYIVAAYTLDEIPYVMLEDPKDIVIG